MKQITNKEYEEWQKYKAEKEKGTIYVTNAPLLRTMYGFVEK